jgi:hypothetical protein
MMRIRAIFFSSLVALAFFHFLTKRNLSTHKLCRNAPLKPIANNSKLLIETSEMLGSTNVHEFDEKPLDLSDH